MKSIDQVEKARLESLAEDIEAIGAVDPANVAVDSVAYHQAHQSAYICLETVSRHLLENEVMLHHPDLYRLADEAHEALLALYQKFGEKIVEEAKLKP